MSKNQIKSAMEKLEDAFVEECTECGECVEDCPNVVYGGNVLADLDPVEISEKRLALLRDQEYSDEAYVYSRGCLLCGACEETCPYELNPYLINIVSRLRLSSWDSPVKEKYREDTKNLDMLLSSSPRNIFRMLHSVQFYPEEITWHRSIPGDPPSAEVVLFLSCMAISSYQRIQTTLEIMDRTGVDYQVIGGVDFCCGFMNTLAGDMAGAEDHLNRMIAMMSAFQAKVFVVDCATCYGWFRDLDNILGLPFETLHFTQFLDSNLDCLDFKREINRKLTLHDTCHFGRVEEEYTAPRNILNRIPGIELVEMEHNRDQTLCCGGPAGGYQPALAKSVGEKRLEEAKAVNPDQLITICDGCASFFQQNSDTCSFEVAKLLDVMAESMDQKIEDRLQPIFNCESVDEAMRLVEGRIWEDRFSAKEIEDFIKRYFRINTDE